MVKAAPVAYHPLYFVTDQPRLPHYERRVRRQRSHCGLASDCCPRSRAPRALPLLPGAAVQSRGRPAHRPWCNRRSDYGWWCERSPPLAAAALARLLASDVHPDLLHRDERLPVSTLRTVLAGYRQDLGSLTPEGDSQALDAHNAAHGRASMACAAAGRRAAAAVTAAMTQHQLDARMGRLALPLVAVQRAAPEAQRRRVCGATAAPQGARQTVPSAAGPETRFHDARAELASPRAAEAVALRLSPAQLLPSLRASLVPHGWSSAGACSARYAACARLSDAAQPELSPAWRRSATYRGKSLLAGSADASSHARPRLSPRCQYSVG